MEWAQSSIASATIKLLDTPDTNNAGALRDSVYVNGILPGREKLIDKSRLRIGKQSLPYIIGPTSLKMGFDWIGCSQKRAQERVIFKYFNDKIDLFISLISLTRICLFQSPTL